MTDEIEFQVHDTRIAYRTAYLAVREEEVTFPDGTEAVYSIVEKPSFSLVVPEVFPGRLCMISCYRHPVRRRFWEFPQGSSTEAEATAAEVAAQELAEETGYSGTRMKWLGAMYEAYGYSVSRCDIFLATGLSPGTSKPEPSEGIVRSHLFSVEEVRDLIRRGEIMDAVTIAAFALYLETQQEG